MARNTSGPRMSAKASMRSLASQSSSSLLADVLADEPGQGFLERVQLAFLDQEPGTLAAQPRRDTVDHLQEQARPSVSGKDSRNDCRRLLVFRGRHRLEHLAAKIRVLPSRWSVAEISPSTGGPRRQALAVRPGRRSPPTPAPAGLLVRDNLLVQHRARSPRASACQIGQVIEHLEDFVS